MSDRPTLEQLIAVRDRFGLIDEAQVEKDWYVVKALAAIMAAEKGPFQLVFQGGTALSRAHRIIQRMSEDIDIKIVSEGKPSRNALRRLRKSITAELLKAGFSFDPENEDFRRTNYEGRYTEYRLPYDAITKGQGVLRPELFIETSAFAARRPPIECKLISYLAEAYEKPAEIPAIACTSITETAAEKFVALTRRAGAELAGVTRDPDPTLVRHIYDLHVIREHYDPHEVAELARDVMAADAESRGKEFPAYGADPLGETLRAVEGLAAGGNFSEFYDRLLRDLVYGDRCAYEAAIASVLVIAEHLKP